MTLHHRAIHTHAYHRYTAYAPLSHSHVIMYRVKGQLQLPLYVKPQISLNSTTGTGRVNIMVGSKLPGGKQVIEDLVVIIPFPKSLTSTNFAANVGQIQFDDLTKVVLPGKQIVQ